MSQPASLAAFHEQLDDEARDICIRLCSLIDRHLPEADSKIWHAHPVWFLDDNPIVGYSRLKDCVRLMFWSGQGFDSPGLSATGSFKAAEKRYSHQTEIDVSELESWLKEAPLVQWDYKNIQKRKGRLDRLV